jgi:hypothetical protein
MPTCIHACILTYMCKVQEERKRRKEERERRKDTRRLALTLRGLSRSHTHFRNPRVVAIGLQFASKRLPTYVPRKVCVCACVCTEKCGFSCPFVNRAPNPPPTTTIYGNLAAHCLHVSENMRVLVCAFDVDKEGMVLETLGGGCHALGGGLDSNSAMRRFKVIKGERFGVYGGVGVGIGTG